MTGGSRATAAVQQETRTIPIVFAGDPVASGIVPRLNQPGGNVTGLATQEATLGGKWLAIADTARNTALASSRLSATPPFGPCTLRSASAAERMIQIYLGLIPQRAVAV